MSYGPTILTPEGSLEVLEEMSRPPEDTPGRRKVLQRMRELEEWEARRAKKETAGAQP